MIRASAGPVVWIMPKLGRDHGRQPHDDGRGRGRDHRADPADGDPDRVVAYCVAAQLLAEARDQEDRVVRADAEDEHDDERVEDRRQLPAALGQEAEYAAGDQERRPDRDAAARGPPAGRGR